MTMPPRSRRRITFLLCSAPLFAAPMLSGCSLFEVPDPLVLQAKPTPPPLKPVFTPIDGSTAGTPLNVANDPVKPDAYRGVNANVEADGSAIIYVQTIDNVAPGSVPVGGAPPTGGAAAPPGGAAPAAPAAGVTPAAGNAVPPQPAPDATKAKAAATPKAKATAGGKAGAKGTPGATVSKTPGMPIDATPTPTLPPGSITVPTPLGTPIPGVILGPRADPIHLAGISLPTTEPFRGAAIITLQNWMASGNLDVEQDKIYPFDLQGRARVQVFFTGRSGTTKGQKLNLNRLMVRSGYAVVDLYSPTTFDTDVWFNDEQVARGLVPGSTAVGLWTNPMFTMERRPPVVPTPAPHAIVKVQLKGAPPKGTLPKGAPVVGSKPGGKGSPPSASPMTKGKPTPQTMAKKPPGAPVAGMTPKP